MLSKIPHRQQVKAHQKQELAQVQDRALGVALVLEVGQESVEGPKV